MNIIGLTFQLQAMLIMFCKKPTTENLLVTRKNRSVKYFSSYIQKISIFCIDLKGTSMYLGRRTPSHYFF